MTEPAIRLIVSIDAEEDNWIATDHGITTRNIDRMPQLHRRFEVLGARATWFTNYHVALDPASADIMRGIHESGNAEIAAHVHPWNTPPDTGPTPTMMRNLTPALQRAKILTVRQQIDESIGANPRCFRAGRFGLGFQTASALADLGFAIDSSVTPFFTWEQYDQGPSYVGAPLHMYLLSGDGDPRIPGTGPVVEAPLSCGYNRWPARSWALLHQVLNSAPAQALRLGSLASRLRVARPVILSPEIHDVPDLAGLADRLIRHGLPFLHVFWHSPSMTPGLSPFCKTEADVQRLLARFESLLETLGRRVSLRFVTLSEAVAELQPTASPLSSADTNGNHSVIVREELLVSVAQPGVAAPALVSAAEDPAHDAAPVGKLGRHAAIYMGGILVGRAVAFLMLPFYTRYLTPSDYGVMQLVEMTLDVISIIAGTRIASGIHRYYFKAATDTGQRMVLSTALILLTVTFAAFGVLTFVLADELTALVLGSTKYAYLMRIAAVTFGLQSLIIVPLAIVQLWKRSVLFTVLTTTKLLVQLALNIVFLAVMGLGPKSVFLSTLIANLVIGVVVTAMVVQKIGLGYSRGASAKLVRYGLPLVGTQFAVFFVTYGDRYFLRVSGDVDQVGLYSLAYQFGFLVASIGYVPFALIWEPTRFQVANWPNRDALYSRAFIFMNALQLIVTVGTALFVRDFIVIMADPAYHSAYKIVPVILAAYLLQSWAAFHEVGILVREQTSWITVANWVAAMVALVGYVLLIPRWLGWGAALTTLAAFLVRWIFTYATAQRLLPVTYDWAPVIRMVGISIVVVLVGITLPHPDLRTSLATRSLLMIVYLWIIWHIDVLAADEKARLVAAVRRPLEVVRNVVR